MVDGSLRAPTEAANEICAGEPKSLGCCEDLEELELSCSMQR